jgi:hypothetical protein
MYAQLAAPLARQKLRLDRVHAVCVHDPLVRPLLVHEPTNVLPHQLLRACKKAISRGTSTIDHQTTVDAGLKLRQVDARAEGVFSRKEEA